ncbi:hypothetical protein ACIP39_02935 [Streptomyces tibetensis]|uniref:hypothetical protein n=1 Tax=Streptomyces tibetensis TaxID=2382123 RepID=UPI00381F8479
MSRDGDRAENLGLLAQQGQVRHHLAAVGGHDREIYRDPAGVGNVRAITGS